MMRWLQKLVDMFKPKKVGYEIFFNSNGINLKKIK